MPKRIQLRRTKGWRKPEGVIVVARPSRWGNIFVVGEGQVSYSGQTIGPCAGRYDPDDQRFADVPIHDGLTAAEAVSLYRADLLETLDDPYFDDVRVALADLRGHDLACWCPLEDDNGNRVPCHADVLLELANR